MESWQSYLKEARRFRDVAQAANDPDHANQAVSNAAHAVIAANDAFCLFLIGKRSKGESHAEAARLLKEACQGKEWEEDVPRRARQLLEVLQYKNASQYYGSPLPPDVTDRVMKQAGRFLEWVEGALPAPAVEKGPPERRSPSDSAR
jgi:HEPN domain-containing protein